MPKKLVLNAMDVAGFTPEWAKGISVSRMLIDKESVGSTTLTINHFTLKPGKETAPGRSHPKPYDEFYYVLHGRGLVRLGDPTEEFELKPDTAVFIPCGMIHQLVNTGTEDLVLLTGMPYQPAGGANKMYEARLKAWGTSFKLAG